MNWKVETQTIYLANGEQVHAHINGIALDGSGSVLVDGREIKVGPLPDTWRSLGYGEIVSIRLQSGETINTVLTPDQYQHHVAWVDVGAIRRDAIRLREPGAIIAESEEAITAVYDQSSSTWREMTEQEYEQERRAWAADMRDQEQIKREWREYRDEGTGA